mmetsp:Transcript_23002/g.42344  ORF Transcript_23002/g.42344 Transcript_23002/m.42344 type:complete len:442 (+) Transcript_23002:41-1366(+)
MRSKNIAAVAADDHRTLALERGVTGTGHWRDASPRIELKRRFSNCQGSMKGLRRCAGFGTLCAVLASIGFDLDRDMCFHVARTPCLGCSERQRPTARSLERRVVPPKPSRIAQKANGALVAASSSSSFFRGLLVCVFVLVDVGQSLTMDWAEKRTYAGGGRQYARQTVLVVNSTLCIISSVMGALLLGGLPAVLQLIDWKCMVAFLPVSFCFAVGLSLKMMAVNYFHAGTIKVFGQFRLPLLAFFSAILLRRAYSVVQWQCIALISVSCMSFVLLKSQGRASSGKKVKWKGYLQLFMWVVLNVLGGIAAEKAYKFVDRPFYVQKVAEDVGHLAISLMMLLVLVPQANPGEDIMDKKERPDGFFDSWNVRTWTVVLFLFIDTWIGNMLIKHCSGVTRSVAKAFSIAAVYFISLLYAKDRKANPSLSLVALLVIQSSLLFSFL